MKNEKVNAESIQKAIKEIRSRGDNLVDAFAEMNAEEFAQIKPHIDAMKESQDEIFAAIEEMRKAG